MIGMMYHIQRFHFEGNFLLKGIFLQNEGNLKEINFEGNVKEILEEQRKFEGKSKISP